MIIRIRRRLTQGEYLDELAAKHGSLTRLERRASRDPGLRPLVDEWRWLAAHPERTADTLSLDHEMIFHDFERFLEVLTPKRLQMLRYLRAHPETESLSELARALERDYRNVHDDATRLAAVGVIGLETRPNRVVPRAIAEQIEVEV